jgi:hypothetical protein
MDNALAYRLSTPRGCYTVPGLIQEVVGLLGAVTRIS